MAAIAEKLTIDWHCRHTWHASIEEHDVVPDRLFAIGDFGTIAFFQYHRHSHGRSTAIMILAIVNGLLTSIALETFILARQMDLRAAFRTAIGMSFISMISMEAAMNAVDCDIDWRRRAHLVGIADHAGRRFRDATALQLLAAQGAGQGMSLKQSAILLVLAVMVGLAGHFMFGGSGRKAATEAQNGPEGAPLVEIALPAALSTEAQAGQTALRCKMRLVPRPQRRGAGRMSPRRWFTSSTNPATMATSRSSGRSQSASESPSLAVREHAAGRRPVPRGSCADRGLYPRTSAGQRDRVKRLP